MVATAPGKNSSQGAALSEELDPDTLAVNDTYGNAVRYQACFVQKISFFSEENQQKLLPP